MRWRGRRVSDQVEDRRGRRVTPARGAGLGCGGLILVLVFAYITGEIIEACCMAGGAEGRPAGAAERKGQALFFRGRLRGPAP